MTIDEVTDIDELIRFTDQEILRTAKFRFSEDKLNLGCLTLKIKIGILIFTMSITAEDVDSSLNQSVKQELAKRSIKFLLLRIRKRTGLYLNDIS